MRLAEEFIENGFVRIDGAVPGDVVEECRTLLWRDTGCDPDDPATWTRPVIRLLHYAQPPFRAAAGSPALREAYDTLAGEGRWHPHNALGTFPVRFPSDQDPGDAGWHIDVSFPGDDPDDYMSYRANVSSKGRWLLVLFLFSDVGEKDAPTRIRVGSHLDVARILEPHGDAGLDVFQIAEQAVPATEDHPLALATGRAGDVYLCHPFLLHSAQEHHGTEPRFMAQPPLLPAEQPSLGRPDGAYSPVEAAILRGLGR